MYTAPVMIITINSPTEIRGGAKGLSEHVPTFLKIIIMLPIDTVTHIW